MIVGRMKRFGGVQGAFFLLNPTPLNPRVSVALRPLTQKIPGTPSFGEVILGLVADGTSLDLGFAEMSGYTILSYTRHNIVQYDIVCLI